jgi:hypothetical protein
MGKHDVFKLQKRQIAVANRPRKGNKGTAVSGLVPQYYEVLSRYLTCPIRSLDPSRQTTILRTPSQLANKELD